MLTEHTEITSLLDTLINKKVKIDVKGDEVTLLGDIDTLTADEVAAIKAHKQDIIEWFQQQVHVDSADAERIPRCDKSQPLLASSSQKRLWFIDQLEGGSAQYNMPFAYELNGEFNAQIAEEALRLLINRHETLRTQLFENKNGELYQRILTSFDFTLNVIDLDFEQDLASQRKHVQHFINQDSIRTFDLSQDLMIRGSFLRLNEQLGILVLNIHHIATDGWSMKVLMEEFGHIYQSLSQGTTPSLPSLDIQYTDYLAWRENGSSASQKQQQIEYWKQQLNTLPSVHDLPLSQSRPATLSHEGANYKFEIESARLNELTAVANAKQMTLFMLLQGMFSLLVSKFSNNKDVVVGTPIANRHLPQLERLVGMFIDTRLLRVNCQSNLNLDEYLSVVKQVNLDAMANDTVSFADLIELLSPERSLSHSPLFQLMFNYSKDKVQTAQTGALQLTSLETDNVSAKYELQLSIQHHDEGLSCNFEYNKSLFSECTIESMAQGFSLLIEQLLQGLEQKLSDLSVLNTASRNHLLFELNQTEADYPATLTMVDLIERNSAANPHDIALEFEDQAISYAELNARVNQLSVHIQEQGATEHKVIGLLFERSVEMVVSMLAILKSGCAYLPIDPQSPPERLKYMLADSKAELVLCQLGYQHRLQDNTSLDVMVVDTELENQLRNTHEGALPTNKVTPEHVAYVIYTSGTTGQPKGVAVSHRALVNRIDWMQKTINLGHDDKVLQKTPFTFDVSVWEFMLPLMSGAVLVLARPEGHKDPHYLATVIREKKVTTLHFVPSMLRAMIDSDKWHTCRSVQRVICSGEALTTDIVAEHFERLEVDIYNLYGPTEAAIDVSYFVCTADQKLDVVPIGKPINNLQLFVLDESLNPVPKGTSGELYIGGVGLAEGYLNKPELTQEKFIPHPFVSGEKLYKTGDLVRYDHKDNLLYQGRTDQQVKIRGFRIELGEIEHQLAKLAEVDASAVIVKSDKNQSQHLVAYVVKSGDQEQTQLVNTIQEKLLKSLPDYMVPDQFAFLDQLPLSDNGKVDRKALPDFTFNATSEFVEPQTDLQRLLCDCFAQFSSVEKAGIKDNYFSIGGDSIQAIKVVAQVNKAGYTLSLKDLFNFPTVEKLSSAIESETTGDSSIVINVEPFELLSQQTLDAINQDVYEDAYPLTKLQQGMLFLNDNDEAAIRYQDQVKVRMRQSWNIELFTQVVQQLADHHEMLRTEFNSIQGDPVQLVRRELNVPVAAIDLRHLQGDEQQRELEKQRLDDRRCRFVNGEVLWRLNAYRLEDNITEITFTCHHAILDGWSIATLLVNLAKSYEKALAQSVVTEADFGPKVKYNLYVANELKALNNAETEQYWKDIVQDAPLPWWTGTKLNKLRLSRYSLSELEGRLVQVAASMGVPVTSVFLTAHLKLLSMLNGSDSILSSVVSHGRSTQEGGENTLGLFLNTAPVVLGVEEKTWRQMVEEVDQQLHQQKVHQYYPVAEIQRNTRTDFSGALFNYLHFHMFNGMVSQEHRDGEQEQPYLSLEHDADVNYQFISNFRHAKEYNALVYELRLHTDLISDKHIEHINRLMFNILSDIVRNTDNYVDHDSLLPAMDRDLLMHKQSPKKVALKDSNLAEVIEKWARETPERTAISLSGKEVTFAELNSEANLLAQALLDQGVGTGERVAICMERSYESVLSMLAILKIGGAYVPVNPAYPQEYMQFMLEDAGVTTGIAKGPSRTLLMAAGVANCISLDSEQWKPAVCNAHERLSDIHVDLSSTAYVNYTSGTTGRPKGVEVTHQGVLRLCELPQLEFGDKQAAFLHASSISFDAATLEIWGTLAKGNRLVIFEPAVLDIQALNRLLNEQQVNGMWLTAALFSQWSERLSEVSGEHLEKVIAGGDVVSPDAVARVYDNFENIEVINGYGPTENTTFTCCYPIPRDFDRSHSIPIGYGIPGTYFYILDRHQKLVPFGAVGELCTGGQGLAKGYINRDDLNSQKFIADPFSQDGERLYRTGDLVRFLENGALEFVGRIDEQVKMRGYRIEPAHIESTLQSLPEVHEAAVILHETASGDSRLYAYIKCDTETLARGEAATDAIKLALQAKLPPYLVPSGLFMVEQMPLTVNGKLDRGQLLKSISEASGQQEIKDTKKTLETELKTLWSQLLDIEIDSLSLDSDFFEVGGHSLLANDLVNSIEKVFSVEVTPVEIFEHPTLQALIDLVNKQLPEQQDVASELIKLWSTILEVDAVELNTESDFFELGGHSLLANQLVAEIQSSFDVKLEPVDIFEHPTLSALCEKVESMVTVSPYSQVLTALWMDLLELDSDEITPSADFFELGGHSLLANQLVQQISEQTGVELQPVDIFDNAEFGKQLDLLQRISAVESQFLNQVIGQYWQTLLDLDSTEIDQEADFFALGGHSLLANELVTNLNNTLMTQIKPVDVFDNAQLGELCCFVREQLTGSDKQKLRLVANAWCDVLDLSPHEPGAWGDFFELGGHSLIANQLIARVNDAFGCHIQPADIFEYSSFVAFFGLTMSKTKSAVDTSCTECVEDEQVELLL
ncbi:amino acid adenylation domain-containing protein [Pseudoalteromonas luteoviolacea]|uniref:non-ribosomal peptide synthetase n=1 Tax=Pseudoalteromonas luteoviolacea TaxID=43657 RepID=UPI001F354A45|nr:non-ribosomal peptide synthetase [Pseudoalteromonas luteoviolacea]MCF6437884.1 amino acid adenylation domain-containing protein [Pseudoalteromonas luteoviolacea]